MNENYIGNKEEREKVDIKEKKNEKIKKEKEAL